jgi:hypothetical protein
MKSLANSNLPTQFNLSGAFRLAQVLIFCIRNCIPSPKTTSSLHFIMKKQILVKNLYIHSLDNNNIITDSLAMSRAEHGKSEKNLLSHQQQLAKNMLENCLRKKFSVFYTFVQHKNSIDLCIYSSTHSN